MALSTNNKLYIGAMTCSNTTAGCLSVVNVTNNTADPPLPPRGAVTGMLADCQSQCGVRDRGRLS